MDFEMWQQAWLNAQRGVNELAEALGSKKRVAYLCVQSLVGWLMIRAEYEVGR